MGLCVQSVRVRRIANISPPPVANGGNSDESGFSQSLLWVVLGSTVGVMIVLGVGAFYLRSRTHPVAPTDAVSPTTTSGKAPASTFSTYVPGQHGYTPPSLEYGTPPPSLHWTETQLQPQQEQKQQVAATDMDKSRN